MQTWWWWCWWLCWWCDGAGDFGVYDDNDDDGSCDNGIVDFDNDADDDDDNNDHNDDDHDNDDYHSIALYSFLIYPSNQHCTALFEIAPLNLLTLFFFSKTNLFWNLLSTHPSLAHFLTSSIHIHSLIYSLTQSLTYPDSILKTSYIGAIEISLLLTSSQNENLC